MKMISQLIKNIRWGGSRYECIVCGSKLRKFFPFSKSLSGLAAANGFQRDFRRMETLNFDQCNCPFCLSSDRERLYLIFIEQYIQSNANSLFRILDFAPNSTFARRMKEKPNVRYTSADLMRDEVDLQIDICNMTSIETASFDVVICSHVLEHVPEPGLAINEVRRILKPDGIAIFMVPLFNDVAETVEDPAYNESQEMRIRYYGQADHVRLFARKDFLNILTSNGFEVEEVRPQHLNAILIDKNAIAGNSILYIGRPSGK